ncbi:hypothetical protein [Kistimonas scapharcae]|uniref:hypothetical protein n=1 Tax=Kistimonas scapharcae TaxID=1036133 RepID=UPI0031E618FA
MGIIVHVTFHSKRSRINADPPVQSLPSPLASGTPGDLTRRRSQPHRDAPHDL